MSILVCWVVLATTVTPECLLQHSGRISSFLPFSYVIPLWLLYYREKIPQIALQKRYFIYIFPDICSGSVKQRAMYSVPPVALSKRSDEGGIEITLDEQEDLFVGTVYQKPHDDTGNTNSLN